MPSLVINTNVSADKIPANFNEEMTTLLEEILGKPRKYIAVLVRPDQRLTFGGSGDAAALCDLGCIGKLGLEENKSHTPKIMAMLKERLEIPGDRIYINFYNLARENVGWNNTTFA